MALSENLQFLRTQNSMTQEQLAEQLNVSRQSVSKWESGSSFPEMETLLRICDLYHVNLDTLLRGSLEESQVSDTAQYDAFMNRFSLRITFAEQLTVRCQTDRGKVMDSIDCQFEGERLEVGFDNRYLLDALRNSGSDKVALALTGPLAPVKVLPVEGNDFLSLVMPVRFKND